MWCYSNVSYGRLILYIFLYMITYLSQFLASLGVSKQTSHFVTTITKTLLRG